MHIVGNGVVAHRENLHERCLVGAVHQFERVVGGYAHALSLGEGLDPTLLEERHLEQLLVNGLHENHMVNQVLFGLGFAPWFRP